MIGATVGSYRVLRQIGEGGMGAVYLGEHAMLGRPAAIKILLPALSHNREMVGRFFNEARATTAIRHPGIVEIYDFGFLPDGAAYIAMEMLDGESLAARLKRVGRLPVAAAIDFGRQCAAALHAAHGRGITHRDLKPDNMFLIRDPEIGERVKLLDFGIAKLAAEEGGSRTRTGLVMGTPVYMSPEQCRGTADLDHRADLYSLGCVLYELVTGRPPFVAESAGDIIAHHLYFEPEPVRRHDPSVPEPFEQLIMALLMKDPGRRPATAADVSAILDGWRGMASAGSSSALPMMPPGMPAPTTGVRTGGGAVATPITGVRTGGGGANPITGVRTGGGQMAPMGATTPTTISGSAGVVSVPPVTAGSRRGIFAIGGGLVAVGAIVVVLMTRSSAPSPTVAAVAPSAGSAQPAPVPSPPPAPVTPPPAAPTPAVAAPTPPPVAAPVTPAPVAVAVTPPAPTPVETKPPVEPKKLVETKPPVEPKIAPSEPKAPKATETAKKPDKAAHVAAAPPPVAAPTKKRDPFASTTPAPAEPKVAPAVVPPPAPEVAQKVEPKAAEPAAPAASKWGKLMGDKSTNTNSVYDSLYKLCKAAATSGDCDKAREYAARIADKNIAMYRARVMTDSDIAACLRSK